MQNKTEKTIMYHRSPTAAEIKFGEGAVHYLEVPETLVRKKDGNLKKWFIYKDGLRYYY